jgi:hypothetical protein
MTKIRRSSAGNFFVRNMLQGALENRFVDRKGSGTSINIFSNEDTPKPLHYCVYPELNG